MREFCKLNISIWNSKRFRKLDEIGKVFYLYCLSSPSGNSAGCFVLPIGYMMTDLQWNESRVLDALKKVVDTTLIDYDYQENVIFIDRWFDYNPPTNPNHSIKVFSDTLSIPFTPLKLKTLLCFSKCLQEKKWSLPGNMREEIERVSKDPVMKKHPTETETETETETKKESDAQKAPGKNIALSDNYFNEFWELFPRQRRGSRDKAESAWRSAITRDDRLAIFAGTKNYSQSREVREGFAKGAAAWLNDDRWTHDYSEQAQPRRKHHDPSADLDAALNDPQYAHLRSSNRNPDEDDPALPDDGRTKSLTHRR